MRRKILSFIIVLLFAAGTPASNVSASPPAQASEFYYGVEYDWNSISPDIDNFTGIDLPEIFGEIMGAAGDAGLNLIIGQVMTGSSNVYVHYNEDVSSQTIQDIDGQNVNVWSRTTDVTLRHGGLIDGIMLADWAEQTFGTPETSFDLDVSASIQDILNVDMVFTEYLDDDYHLIGADMSFSMYTDTSVSLSIDAVLEGDDETLPIDFDFGVSIGYSITNSNSQWRLSQPDPLYIGISANDNYHWDCQDCGILEGVYDGAVDYSVSLTGIPTEDFGLDDGSFDIEISDEISKTNQNFDSDIQAAFDFTMGQNMVVDIGNGDGLSTQVKTCDNCPPGNPLMFLMMGNVLVGASESFAEEVADEFSEQLSDNIGDIFGIGGDEEVGSEPYEPEYFYCDNGETVYEWYVNDGYDHCSDGSDEDPLYFTIAYSYPTNQDVIYTSFEAVVSGDITSQSNALMFQCDNGEYIDWLMVNDGYGHCADNSDEYSETNPRSFTCSDGSVIGFELLNDGLFDCNTAEDEGIDGLYTLNAVLYDEVGNVINSDYYFICASQKLREDSTPMCEIDQPYDFYTQHTLNTVLVQDNGAHEICLQLSVSKVGDANWPGVNSDLSCNAVYVGPSLEYAELYFEGDRLFWNTNAYDSSNAQDSYMNLNIIGPNNNSIIQRNIPHSGEYSIGDNGDIAVFDEGTYCLEVRLINSDDDSEFYQELQCEDYEPNPEPSERLRKIFEAFGNSNIDSMMENFAENLDTRMNNIEPLEEFPYNDGMWAPMWSNEHAVIVGVGVYVMDDDGDYVMAGPATQGYSSNLPAKMSIRYLTGIDASTAAEDMEDADELDEIVNIEQHDLTQIENDLQEAGVDTSGLEFESPTVEVGEDNQDTETSEAEEKAESDGLLPFLSPVSILLTVALAGILFANRKD